jgi:hypothetical protein
MPAWPTYAKILIEGFAEQRESGVKVSDMESGPPKVVLIKSRVMVTRPVKVLLISTADYLAFVDWFRGDIKQGVMWFDWYDPVAKVTKKARIKAGELGAAAPLATIKKDAGWLVTLNLETWQ